MNRDEMFREVANAATSLDERMLKLSEIAQRRDAKPADVVWCRMALLAAADVDREQQPRHTPCAG